MQALKVTKHWCLFFQDWVRSLVSWSISMLCAECLLKGCLHQIDSHYDRTYRHMLIDKRIYQPRENWERKPRWPLAIITCVWLTFTSMIYMLIVLAKRFFSIQKKPQCNNAHYIRTWTGKKKQKNALTLAMIQYDSKIALLQLCWLSLQTRTWNMKFGQKTKVS